MNFNEAMNAECEWCHHRALNHRLTDSGNFYCLEPKDTWNSRYMDKEYQTRWATSRAPVRELRKSPLSQVKEIGKVIIENLRVPPTVSGIQDTLL